MNGPGVIPWSAEREHSLRIQSALSTGGMIGGVIVACAGVVMLSWWTMLGGVLAAIVAWIWEAGVSQALENVLHNRPGSARGFARPQTEWKSHQHSVSAFLCECGAANSFTGKPFMPNGVDATGGRYVVHCRCGIGHYKIAAPAEKRLHTSAGMFTN